jgi:hypothetical protein
MAGFWVSRVMHHFFKTIWDEQRIVCTVKYFLKNKGSRLGLALQPVLY